jgi:hypothetical protein
LLTQNFMRKSQHDQWLRDNTLAECRILLEALTKAYAFRRELHRTTTAEDRKRSGFDVNPTELEVEAYRVISSRILIDREGRIRKLGPRWHNALRDYRESDDGKKFGDDFQVIVSSILFIATGKDQAP